MTQWDREYAARFERLPASIECLDRSCWCAVCPKPHIGYCLTVAWPTNDGPYAVVLYHAGFIEAFYEQTYREGPGRGEEMHRRVNAFLQAGHDLVAEAKQPIIIGSLLDVA